MNKPLTIVYQEFKQELANLINNSDLPIVMIESILQNYLNEVSNLAKRQCQIDKIEYDKFLLEQNNVNNNTKNKTNNKSNKEE